MATSTKSRIVVAALSLSAAGLIAIATDEGYAPVAVPPVKGDVPTLGFGDTQGVKAGDKTTPVRALVKLGDNAGATERILRSCIKSPLYQYEWDAYVRWAFNVGPGAACGSTVVRLVNAGEYAQACNGLLAWDKFKGKRLAGLTARRQRERAQCLGETS